mmetsp:Transcript_33339/g.95485  ORF Transcript_33339/g.95485 Transcript_33339/m.95485 type:complete len:268 (+) Transcript_33339:726-1529(+)
MSTLSLATRRRACSWVLNGSSISRDALRRKPDGSVSRTTSHTVSSTIPARQANQPQTAKKLAMCLRRRKYTRPLHTRVNRVFTVTSVVKALALLGSSCPNTSATEPLMIVSFGWKDTQSRMPPRYTKPFPQTVYSLQSSADTRHATRMQSPYAASTGRRPMPSAMAPPTGSTATPVSFCKGFMTAITCWALSSTNALLGHPVLMLQRGLLGEKRGSEHALMASPWTTGSRSPNLRASNRMAVTFAGSVTSYLLSRMMSVAWQQVTLE